MCFNRNIKYFMVSWSYHFECFTVPIMIWLTVTEYMSQMTTDMFTLSLIHNHSLSSFTTCHRIVDKSYTGAVTIETRTAYNSKGPEFTPVFRGTCVAQSSVFCVAFRKSLFVILSFGHRSLCSSAIYGFWLHLCHLETF
jgi:hypothetical protein